MFLKVLPSDGFCLVKKKKTNRNLLCLIWNFYHSVYNVGLPLYQVEIYGSLSWKKLFWMTFICSREWRHTILSYSFLVPFPPVWKGFILCFRQIRQFQIIILWLCVWITTFCLTTKSRDWQKKKKKRNLAAVSLCCVLIYHRKHICLPLNWPKVIAYQKPLWFWDLSAEKHEAINSYKENFNLEQEIQF